MNWWSLIKQNPEAINRKIDNDPYFLIVWGTVTGKTWAKDESGFSKYKEIMEIMDNADVEPAWVKKMFIIVDGDNYNPKYWNDSTGWNINELNSMLTNIHGQPSWFK